MNDRDDLPATLRNLEGSLSQFEPKEEDDWDGWETGEDIIREMEERTQWSSHNWINIIPGRVPDECHDTLLVVVGTKEKDLKLENRILEALKHVSVECRGKTNNILFWAGNWNSRVWSKHANAFNGHYVWLKPFWAKPTRLQT